MNEPDETVPVARRRRSLEATVPVWALGFVSLLCLVTCLSVWAFVLVTRPTIPRVTSSAVFIVVTRPASTGGAPDPLVVTSVGPTPEAPTPTVPPLSNPGFINLGSFVQVAHTEGDPLKLRQSPSLSAETNYLAVPNEVFRVENGPTIADGFTWWFLVDPLDGNRNGWAVENYLQATTGP
jgi:hypothetical protein